ncbi:MAG: Do family serine endopeptidase [Spirochaetaceae bacterium]|nr:Do family serine endopeptidase [Spirochaetaceae bacterium]
MNIRNRKIPLMLIVITILFQVALYSSGKTELSQDQQSTVLTETEQPARTLDLDPQELQNSLLITEALQNVYRNVAAQVLPGVVEINVVEIQQQTVSPNGFNPRDLFGDQWPFGPPSSGGKSQQEEPREFRRQGLGSGVLLRSDGDTHYVVTNNHVVGNADEISIRLYDGREFDAQLVGKDDRTDLALVSFQSDEEIPLLTMGNSNDLFVGDMIFAVGNPLGFESTVTQGIVSALGRQVQQGSNISTFTDYIQTDASINPGNSGGALVNLHGELVGINSWIASGNGGSVGIGFAIPVNLVKRAIDDFIDDGEISYGWLGVSIADVSPSQVDQLDLPNEKGALAVNLFVDSPADKSGILPGDFIYQVNDNAVESSDDLVHIVGSLPPGEESSFQIIRYGQNMTIGVTLENRKSEEEIQGDLNLWPGIIPTELDDEIRGVLELDSSQEGLVITGVYKGSSAEMAGFRQGDVITRVDNKPVSSLIDFYKQLNESGNEEHSFRIQRGEREHEILLGLVE